MNIILGSKYFDKDINIIRIISEKNPDKIKAIREEDGEKIILTYKELEENYTLLSADAFVMFNIVKIKNLEDVIILVYRKKEEIDTKEPIPYIVCRQNITDFFTNSISPQMQYCGISISKDTAPEGVNLQQVMACDGLESADRVAIYIDDTLDSILSLIKTKLYDNVLYTLFMDHLRYVSKSRGGDIYFNFTKNENMVDGYCKSLKGLLASNNFMYDIHRGFGIFPLDIDLGKDEDSNLSAENKSVLESLLCKNITESLVVKFKKDIDLTKIKKDYVLVSDIHENLYLVAYRHHGKYHIPVESIETAENIQKIAASIGYHGGSSATEAYKHIRLNRDKY